MIDEVILYNNGLQAYERQVEAEGNVTINLFFKVKDMPEILKSLKLTAHKIGKKYPP